MEDKMLKLEELPVAIIGAGPVGLAAAAHLVERGVPVKLYEAGSHVGSYVRDWSHVSVFTPWRYCVDQASVRLLRKNGWRMPDPEAFPTGGELVSNYFEPLAAVPEIASVLDLNARVVAISRWGIDKVGSKERASRPFVLLVKTPHGTRRDAARAVIDASGTWGQPNPLGVDGLPAAGELENADRIAYGIPDVQGKDRAKYENLTTLVIGAGHSAANSLLDLARLKDLAPRTQFLWATRGSDLARIYSGGDADELPARGELGANIRELVESKRVDLVTGFAVTSIYRTAEGLLVEGQTRHGARKLGPVDRIIAATGQRPDLSITREIRLDLDPWLESTRALGPLIDPNEHSCGTVPPHGHRELSHPEPGFYTVGIKSYGRAPTFLLLTGYEQVRSVTAALTGDLKGADAIELILPETGICSGPPAEPGAQTQGCCGGPSPADTDACCVLDAQQKALGRSGCGCGAPA